jgi:PPK2 family polyphosphate:nucleotide phosphotransferase
MNLSKRFVVEPGRKIRLSKYDPEDTAGFKDKTAALDAVKGNTVRLAELQYLLYAENKHALLIVLQAMDGGGKDGTIRHVMSGLNPQGCTVTPFKVPSHEEADHDYLWRIHKRVPPRGEIGIFNRSHYEEVLVVRVHNLVPKSVWSRRYSQINAFERILAENNVNIIKFFLHISKDEQERRFQQRLDDPTKNWKLEPADFEERKYWDEYMEAFEVALSRCSTSWAPWFIIPADRKWFRNLAVSQIIVEALEDLKMKFPKPKIDPSKIHLE